MKEGKYINCSDSCRLITLTNDDYDDGKTSNDNNMMKQRRMNKKKPWFALKKKSKYAEVDENHVDEEDIGSSEDVYDMTNIFTVAINSDDEDDENLEKKRSSQLTLPKLSPPFQDSCGKQSGAPSYRKSIQKHLVETQHETGTLATSAESSLDTQSYNDESNSPLKSVGGSAFVEWSTMQEQQGRGGESFLGSSSTMIGNPKEEVEDFFAENNIFSNLPFESLPDNFFQDLASSLEQAPCFETIVDDIWPPRKNNNESGVDNETFLLEDMNFDDDEKNDDFTASGSGTEINGLMKLCNAPNNTTQEGEDIQTGSENDSNKIEDAPDGESRTHSSSRSSARERHVLEEVELDFFSGKLQGIYSGDSIMTPEGPVPHGRGKVIFSNGDAYRGQFQKGKLHGKRGTYKSKADNTKYSGEYQYDLKHGVGKQRFANGKLYVGQYHHNFPHGHGVELDESGKVIHCGKWKEGVPVLHLS